MKVRLVLISLIIFIGFLVGCQISNNSDPTAKPPALPTPTIHPGFIVSSRSLRELPVATGLFSKVTSLPTPTKIIWVPFKTSTPKPSPTTVIIATLSPTVIPAHTSPTVASAFTAGATPSPTPTITPTEPDVYLAEVYTDKLNDNWRYKTTGVISVDLANTAYKHNGSNSIAITPQEDLTRVIFYVIPGTNQQLLRGRVLGIRFWLNSGEEPLAIDDLGLGIIGSDKSPYWISPDDSVKPELFDPIFTEEGEYLLDFNRTVPANTWVEVEITLDDLEYDTNYEYVTGFQLKNNVGFERTFYIDDINFLLMSNRNWLLYIMMNEER